MNYDQKYPQYLASARDVEMMIKIIGVSKCVICDAVTSWYSLFNKAFVCSEECKNVFLDTAY